MRWQKLPPSNSCEFHVTLVKSRVEVVDLAWVCNGLIKLWVVELKIKPEKMQKSMRSRRLPPSTLPLDPRSSGFWHSRSRRDWKENTYNEDSGKPVHLFIKEKGPGPDRDPFIKEGVDIRIVTPGKKLLPPQGLRLLLPHHRERGNP